MFKWIHKELCRLIGYTVSIQWEDKYVWHYTMCYDDAIDWMRQYPKDASVIVFAGSQWIAER